MSIVCGTDFSPASLRAARIAGRLAHRLGTHLLLVNVIDVPMEGVFSPWRTELENAARLALEREVESLRGEGIEVHGHLLRGLPDEEITAFAQANAARMLVISALGTRSPQTWQVGGSADRIVQLATVPVLVVRRPEPFAEWLDGKRALRVQLGTDRTEASHEALGFVRTLREVGPCDVTVIHLYWAPDQYHRLGLAGIRSIVDTDPDVERILRQEISAEVGALPGQGEVRIHVEPCLGRPSGRLIALAQEQDADVFVVGSHRRNLVDRLWNGSSSRTVLHGARTNVACATAPQVPKKVQVPEIRTVLVATDFSDIGNAAIRWAYGLVRGGGVVHLVNVHEPEVKFGPLIQKDIFESPPAPGDQARVQALRRQLEALEPDSARNVGVSTRVHVLSSDMVGPAICQAAERLNADVVVVGTHGRRGVVRAVLGSVAQDVAARCSRPVMLVRPPGG